jgi:hypothetical protein
VVGEELIGNAFEEVTIDYRRCYPGIYLERLRRTMKDLRIAGARLE